MKKSLFILVFGLISLSSIGIVRADEPYVYISFEQENVKLGSMLIWDTIIPEALTLKVNSNCFHGSVVATMSSLKNKAGSQIMQDRISIRTVATGGFVVLNKPVAISMPEFGSHDIVIDFKVKANGLHDRAGKYFGEIAFTVMPPA